MVACEHKKRRKFKITESRNGRREKCKGCMQAQKASQIKNYWMSLWLHANTNNYCKWEITESRNGRKWQMQPKDSSNPNRGVFYFTVMRLAILGQSQGIDNHPLTFVNAPPPTTTPPPTQPAVGLIFSYTDNGKYWL